MREKCEHCTEDAFDTMNEDLAIYFKGAKHCPFCGRYLGKNDYHATQKPTVYERDKIWDSEVEERHPAYAQLSFSRQSGGHSNLYGSAIKHQETISMTVSKSVKHTSGYSERYFAGGIPLIEVRMSQAQFAQAITSMNQGSGIPVTLEALQGKVYPKCQEITVSEKANNDLNVQMKKFADKISKGQARINEIVAKKGTILKGERKEIKNIYDMLMQSLRSNLPFLHECMTEAYDKTAMSAKADIEAFYDNAIRRMGVEAMDLKRIEMDEEDHSMSGSGLNKGGKLD